MARSGLAAPITPVFQLYWFCVESLEPSSEKASSSSKWLSLMFQSSFAPQKPLLLSLVFHKLPAGLVEAELPSRCSYIANRNSLSRMIGPDAHRLAFMKLLLSRLERLLTLPSS